MRRVVHFAIGVIEVAVAIALVVIGLQLPSRQEVSENFGRVGKVTQGSEKQVHLMKDQVADLRKQDLVRKTEELRRHTRTAADVASSQQIDFRTVDAIARSLADVSKGLNTWADTVDAERMKQVSAGLGETASFLDKGVADPSEKSAADLEVTLAAMEKDASKLAAYLRQSRPDLKSTKAMYDGLASFDTGLDKLGELVKPERVTTMREGLTGLETTLSSTADQVDKVSTLMYPLITFNGLKANVEMKPFWPDADKAAEGLRKATKGVQASNKELEVLGKSLPELQKSILESRKSVGQTRDALGTTLKEQAEVEKAMKNLPEQTAALAEAMPKIGKMLTTMLRETKRLRELAAGLRTVRDTLDTTLKGWPQVAGGLKKSAVVLDQARVQLDAASANRGEYEKAMQSSSSLARSLADLLPAFTDQLDNRLSQQEASLAQMETGLVEVNQSLPMMEEKTSNLIQMVKWLLCLVGALVTLHAAWVLSDAVGGGVARRTAPPETPKLT